MSSSTTSLYNSQCDNFRRRRGENLVGAPGEKIGKDESEDTGDNNKSSSNSSKDGDDDDTTTTVYSNLTKNGKKIGPPMNHDGVSHHNKITLPSMRYCLGFAESPT